MTLQLVLLLFHACERLYRIEIVISNFSLYFCFVRFGVSDGEGAVVDGGGALLDGNGALLVGDDGDRALHGISPRSKGKASVISSIKNVNQFPWFNYKFID